MAPMASRTETSFARAAPRTSSSVARLLHAIASTRPTMTSTNEASAMNGASACGWIAHVGRRHHRDARAQCKLARWRYMLRNLGVEPASEHVHRGSGLRHGDALAQARFHE